MKTSKLLSALVLSLAAGALVMPATASARDDDNRQHRYESSRPHSSYQHGHDARRYDKRGHADHKYRPYVYSKHDYRKHGDQRHSVYRPLPRRVIYVVPGVTWGFSVTW